MIGLYIHKKKPWLPFTSTSRTGDITRGKIAEKTDKDVLRNSFPTEGNHCRFLKEKGS